MVSAGKNAFVTRVAAAAGVIAGACLLLGVTALALGVGALRDWLAVLLGINSGFGDVSLASLRAVNPVDIALLVLAALTFAGFWPGPNRPHKVWMGVAIGLPLAGIAVLVATGLAGRSGLMGGGIALAILLLGDRVTRPLGAAGVAANSLLLVGDFATAGPRAPAIAVLVGVGYVLLIVWFFWLAVRLVLTRPASELLPHT